MEVAGPLGTPLGLAHQSGQGIRAVRGERGGQGLRAGSRHRVAMFLETLLSCKGCSVSVSSNGTRNCCLNTTLLITCWAASGKGSACPLGSFESLRDLEGKQVKLTEAAGPLSL